ncbi:carbohydrate porin [Photorhabdus aegyptia]|uniref:Raffinose porin n=1 Tax=Photorhabdus aegyptia TaxID=2805098 RepID=A0A022PRI5_9GAMM|nr:carbohydrate porin [Photorhabdus aegyptia]EYU16935.1 raffinose porin [Photorhabdus aegyptia]
MKNLRYLIVTPGLMFATSALASPANSIEARLDALEQRLQQAEQRAAQAEARATIAEQRAQRLEQHAIETKQQATQVAQSTTSLENKALSTSNLKMNDFGALKLYGDVEFNLDGASRTGQLTSLKTNGNKDWKPGDKERWNVNGRILVGLDGYRRDQNNNFAGFRVQPLADMTGKMNLDDAAFFFGNEKNWQVKIGRFEAYDMFPLNQDTFIQYSGNTANDLYADGFGYIYMMKEGRGRSNSGGNLMLSKYVGNWYFELNTLLEDGTSLFRDSTYHGNTLENKKNVAYLRPVAAWKKDQFSAAVAMESNIVNNAYGYQNNQGQWVDQSRRNGYGLTLSWNGLETNPDDGIVANLNTAYLDASDEHNFTTGINVMWHRFELGYIYAHNNIETFNTDNMTARINHPFSEPGKYDINTIHMSYQIPSIMNMKNFNLYLGAYVSMLEANDNNKIANSNNDRRYGARARFKYLF